MSLLIIPLGGVGARFHRYRMPKCFVPCQFKPILFWLLACIDQYAPKPVRLIIPYDVHLNEWDFASRVKQTYPQFEIHFIPVWQSKGATETMLLGLKYLEQQQFPDSPILSLDSDTFYKTNIFQTWLQGSTQNALFGFQDHGSLEQFSYIESDVKNNIIQIKEKQRISHLANVGLYGFQSWKEAMLQCEYVLSEPMKNEYYLSYVVSRYIAQKQPFIVHHVQDFVCLGTPHQLELFIHANPNANTTKYRFCFDLDGTLVTETGDYSTVQPIDDRISMVRYLYDHGHTIIIHTARRMKTHHGNVGKLLTEIGMQTFQTLEEFQIPYHEIYFGKPFADVYIDDKALLANQNLERALGFAVPTCASRFFHSIRLGPTSVTKTGSDLRAEIESYQRLPDHLKEFTPKLLEFSPDHTSFTIERIFGVPLSKLYLSYNLTEDILHTVLTTLQKWHQTPHDCDVDVSQNWLPKLQARWQQNESIYLSIDDQIASTYHTLCEELKGWKGQPGICHGDPVFSNIFLQNDLQVRFIDMRGKQGDTNTLIGDIFYDWAKIYQSLVGYDCILQDTPLSGDYTERLTSFFKNWFHSQYPNQDLNVLTASLLFSLIPLHRDEPIKKIRAYVNLARSLIK